jgi:flagellar export protein FliJ
MRLGLRDGGTYSAEEISRLANYGEFLTQRIKQQKVVVEDAIRVAEQARERYIEASREAKVIEMLRERKLAEYNAEQLRREGAFLDELGQRARIK